ncbi:MAG: adenylate/guanylate cyclase domain-containing protein [Thermodesulfobacteriota bacterium]
MDSNLNAPKERSNRIVLFADLRDSTDILLNFEHGNYRSTAEGSQPDFSYEQFILDVHETTFKELYLGHENTYAEVYGDGVMGIFPEDNTKYILENIYRLTGRMRRYNDSPGVGVSRPKIDMGVGITLGEVGFVYYPFDDRDHPVGQCIHEAARIQVVSKHYDARVLISHRFFDFAQDFVNVDPRFSFRFIDQVVLKGFQEPVTLFELLLDNDPRVEIKTKSIPAYDQAYSRYRDRCWKEAKETFMSLYQDYRLGTGAVMARRCDMLAKNPPEDGWNGVWIQKD